MNCIYTNIKVLEFELMKSVETGKIQRKVKNLSLFPGSMYVLRIRTGG